MLKLQKALLELGFNPNGTDGKFGRGTETAVKAYQAARGLEVDGKAGTKTLTMLYGETDGGGWLDHRTGDHQSQHPQVRRQRQAA